MKYKHLLFIFGILFSHFANAQNEFITIWKPSKVSPNYTTTLSAPSPANSNQIWFPGTGTNYTIQWEEINYPQHNATLQNVNSNGQILIDFGTPLNPIPNEATYRLKVSNGNGVFNQIRFSSFTINQNGVKIWTHHGNSDKLLAIAQWGNIQWTSMFCAFAYCRYVELTASDSPNLSNVTDASNMFFSANGFAGNPSMANWDTSNIRDFSFMFSQLNDAQIPDLFNSPIGSWNTSQAMDFSYMFENRKAFNSNLNSWDTSNVTNMGFMFSGCNSFNQPLDNWNTSNVTSMTWMFHFIPVFNQPLNTWNTSKVTNFSHMFHGCSAFNQPLDNWDTSKATDINTMLQGTTSFNQSLETWNLPLLQNAFLAITITGLDCNNYSNTLAGWALNPNTANNINLGPLMGLMYASNVIPERTILLNKGWTISGDNVGECERLSVHDSHFSNQLLIYPNPATDFIYIKNLKGDYNYKIFDQAGRLIMNDDILKDKIDIQSLLKGNYILQIQSKTMKKALKFIKK